jgi:hypothetical protein
LSVEISAYQGEKTGRGRVERIVGKREMPREFGRGLGQWLDIIASDRSAQSGVVLLWEKPRKNWVGPLALGVARMERQYVGEGHHQGRRGRRMFDRGGA